MLAQVKPFIIHGPARTWCVYMYVIYLMSLSQLGPIKTTPRMSKSQYGTHHYAWSGTHLVSLYKYNMAFVTSAIKANLAKPRVLKSKPFRVQTASKKWTS